MIVAGKIWIFVNSVEQLQDIYVNKTANVTKHPSASHPWTAAASRAIAFGATSDKVYLDKRKELSGAFFKSKLVGLTEIIKDVTLKKVREI
jgi:hypothetical protein